MAHVTCQTTTTSPLSTESWLSLAFPQYGIEAQERNEASSSSSSSSSSLRRRVVGVLEGTFFCTSARMLLVLFVLCSFMAK